MGAPLQPVPGVLRVVLSGKVDNNSAFNDWANVLHFTYGGSPPDNGLCAAIAGNISGFWAANIASLCPSPTALESVTVTDLTSTTSGQGENFTSHAGTRGDDSIPANAAVLISYPSAIRYKGGKPRTYLFVLGNADLNGATNWNTAATGEVQTKWRAFLTQCTLAGSGATTVTGFCSVRYRGKFLPNSGPPHFYLNTPIVNPIPAASAVAQFQMASQRGRIERRKA